MNRLRKLVRHGVLSGLSAVDSVFSREKSLGDQQIVQVVNLHHIYEHEEDAFRKFLAWFKETYQVVSYPEAARRIETGDVDAAYGAITFDDGLKSIVPAGKILAEFDIPATFFVCPTIVGETDPKILRQFCELARMYYESDQFADWQELCELKDLNHEIGNHTLSHVELSKLEPQHAAEEIGAAQEQLERELGDTRHFAWPFGKFECLGRSGKEALANFDFDSIASGERGAHRAELPVDQHTTTPCVRRDNIEANWPISHIRYFLIRNAINPVNRDRWWPADWDQSRSPVQR